MPEPEVPAVTVSHELPDTAVQEHPLAVVTVTVLAPPKALMLADAGFSAYVQEAAAAACVIVSVCPAIVSVPVLGAPVLLAATE